MNSKLKKGLSPMLAFCLLALAGCSNQSGTASLTPEQEAAKEVVENYLTDFKEAKLSEADAYVDPDNNNLQLGSAMDMVAQLYEALGLSQEQIDMFKNLEYEAMANLVQSFSIGEITTDSDNKVTVNVEITGITPSSLANIQSTDLVDAMTDTVADAAQDGLDSADLQAALDSVLDAVKEQTAETTSAIFTVEEIDGTWLITNTENFADLNGENSSTQESEETETSEDSSSNSSDSDSSSS